MVPLLRQSVIHATGLLGGKGVGTESSVDAKQRNSAVGSFPHAISYV